MAGVGYAGMAVGAGAGAGAAAGGASVGAGSAAGSAAVGADSMLSGAAASAGGALAAATMGVGSTTGAPGRGGMTAGGTTRLSAGASVAGAAAMAAAGAAGSGAGGVAAAGSACAGVLAGTVYPQLGQVLGPLSARVKTRPQRVHCVCCMSALASFYPSPPCSCAEREDGQPMIVALLARVARAWIRAVRSACRLAATLSCAWKQRQAATTGW
jgi:hypothetical protein